MTLQRYYTTLQQQLSYIGYAQSMDDKRKVDELEAQVIHGLPLNYELLSFNYS